MSTQKVRVGDYGYEIYRFAINIEGEIEKQGKGVSGKVLSIKKNRGKKVVMAELENVNGDRNHFIPIKFVTNNKDIFEYLDGIDAREINGGKSMRESMMSSHTKMQEFSVRAIKAEDLLGEISATPWWKFGFGIQKKASEFMTKLHLK